MTEKAKDIYSGLKKILQSPSLSSSSGRRSGSFSLGGALASFSLSGSSSGDVTRASRETRASNSSLSARGYGDADLSAAAAAAADEMYGDKPKKKERRPSFSFASWKDKHRSKKHEQQAQTQPSASTATGTSRQTQAQTTQRPARSHSPAYAHSMNTHTAGSSRNLDRQASVGSPPGSASQPPPPPTSSSSSSSSSQPGGRSRSSTNATIQRADSAGSGRSRAVTSAAPPRGSLSSSGSYSFSARQQEKTRTTNQASTMVMDDVATIVKPRRSRARPSYPDSDTDEDGDSFEDTQQPRTRGLSRRSVSMDFMEPQQPTHLISKIWRKLPIQARLYGRGSIDLDLEKDRTSLSRSSASKQLRSAASSSSDEYSIPTSPLPDETNIFGDKHIRFNHQVVYSPADGPHVALESYDDVLVRVCHFAAHDQRRTVVKVQEFLERSMCFLRGTCTRRGQKVSISNDEIRMWRRLARHDWPQEEITRIEDAESAKAAGGGRRASGSSVTEEETDDDDVVIEPDMTKLKLLVTVVNYCINSGDSLFTTEDVEEMVTLELLVEEDGWI